MTDAELKANHSHLDHKAIKETRVPASSRSNKSQHIKSNRTRLHTVAKQPDKPQETKIIKKSSKALYEVEMRYSQCEKEGYAALSIIPYCNRYTLRILKNLLIFLVVLQLFVIDLRKSL